MWSLHFSIVPPLLNSPPNSQQSPHFFISNSPLCLLHHPHFFIPEFQVGEFVSLSQTGRYPTPPFHTNTPERLPPLFHTKLRAKPTIPLCNTDTNEKIHTPLFHTKISVETPTPLFHPNIGWYLATPTIS